MSQSFMPCGFVVFNRRYHIVHTMTSGAFCPRCGESVSASSDDRTVSDSRTESLCDACYFEQFELVDAPSTLELAVCSHCGAVKDETQWRDVGAADYTDVAIEAVTESLGVHLAATDVEWGVEPEQIDQNTIRMHCVFSGQVRGSYRREEVTVPVRISRQSCRRCGRIAGGYYASIVQLRGDGREPSKEETERAIDIAETYVADREATGDRDAFITEITETSDGTDIKISTNQLGSGVAKRIIRELGGTVEEYPTLVTEDGDGNEVYRVTYAVRLPKYAPGEIIEPETESAPVLVRSVAGNLKGVRLDTGESYEAAAEAGSAPQADRVGTVEQATETTVVNFEDTYAMQVLDPETYASVTVARPTFVDSAAETVSVIRSHSGLYVLPEASISVDS
jgi:nonsense-mediated mRNA decay protein 3